MKEFFKELFNYTYQVNQKLSEAFTRNPDKTSEKSIGLYSHILNAHHIWMHRINGLPPTYGVWEIHPIQNCMDIDKSNYRDSLRIIDQFDLNGVINFKNTKGLVFNDNIRNILFHVINHSNYHRAQIATEFRQNGLDPIVTDYILHKR